MKYTENISVEYRNGDKILLAPLWARTKIKGGIFAFKIPKGFKTDFASIPRIFWTFIAPEDQSILIPSIIHDFVYSNHKIKGYDLCKKDMCNVTENITHLFTRKQADLILREKMKSFGAGIIKRNLVYIGVRLGGWLFWNKNKK